ncbi:fimbria/pilus periplasmic chaperone [Xenorhabdus nematophila]|uniref:Periplasmic fimbrial chaperone, MrxD n=2 Tax=Xenorhabdus nematophila TaxID=628 RepID=D3VB56_XENNA|nr:fimbria/pilus periplasmic chaperone [Xenorhabdus nematophila]CEE90583.1 Periplasmic fimbrial chaperone precursor, MrxD [Xenorhabdus nematophila str. Anatoliense]CEF28760.1 Periplasmic fimbrial chaperone precursor, MrxD [Xenorhabdus nematophila str. Websteri]AAM91933.1 chaperone [Xenorhabdus nematophila]AYA42313.1 molecular chaperone [Xenorhabdus nematophila]KHD29217.1 molecular chaperone [Xenorhabdus nematophila]
MKLKKFLMTTAIALTGLMSVHQAMAAITLDRTRVIFNGDVKSVSLNIENQHQDLPYLAQSWIEDEKGNKINSPLVVVPPVQRVEAGSKSQIKIQTLPAIAQLPQDRESLFYFNVREIPPRSEKPNVLQLALQTRIKLFYRPEAVIARRVDLDNPWQEKLTLTREGNHYLVNNPTPYYITLSEASNKLEGQSVEGFQPLMLAPKSSEKPGGTVNSLGNTPVLTYVNDYGGHPQLIFSCSGNTCTVAKTVTE